jgi:putative membrane protein
MIRKFLSAATIVALTGLIGFAQNPNPNAPRQNPPVQNQPGQVQQQQPQQQGKLQATITEVDQKNQTVTVRMKDSSGKDVEKTFRLTGDIRYFDSTGRAAAINIFRSGDYVLVVEAEGRLKEISKAANEQAGQRNGKLGPIDSEFLRTVAEINMAELKLGKLAQDRATAANVKQFGQRLVTDHTKMVAELQKIAQNEQATLPTKLDEKFQDLFDQLSKVAGANFDSNFARDMVKGHEEAIQKFEAQAKNGQDAELKAFAEKWLPKLREHLQLARNLGNQGR